MHYTPIMPPHEKRSVPPKTKSLLDALRSWCDEPGGYGRRAEIAKLTGVSRQSVTHWFAGRQLPTAEQALTIQEFLKAQKRSKVHSPPSRQD